MKVEASEGGSGWRISNELTDLAMKVGDEAMPGML